jgi:glycyl-tRNA synthetase
MADNTMDKIVSLCKRRGFVFPGSEIYGGLANSWDFGPYGTELKNNIKQYWWKIFVHGRDDLVGLDSAIIMNPEVWKASGHIDNFSDPLIECKECHGRFRADQISGIEVIIKPGDIGSSWKIPGGVKCPVCGKNKFTNPTIFNLMFKTFIGSTEDDSSVAYLRPETAQGIFINFDNIVNTTRKKLPFGVAQIGKAFRNEITPGNFIFRTREFEQMEIEYFFNPKKESWEEKFEMWLEAFKKWMNDIGIDSKKLYFHDIEKGELAHYSKKTIDVEFDFPFGRKELFGLAYRGDFDLKNHKIYYTDPETQEKFIPHVIEPSLGVDRMMLAVLVSAYTEEKTEDDVRVVLKIDKKLAPIKIAVFPLMKNKPELVTKAKEIFEKLKTDFMCEFDDNGNVGKRYRRQDEIGTPYCVTVDFESLEDGAVTVRDRDTMKQERIKIPELLSFFKGKLN